jgi:hypothetical protein
VIVSAVFRVGSVFRCCDCFAVIVSDSILWLLCLCFPVFVFARR